ncbi:MAG TPA: hypothetical protein VFF20_02640 [Pseudogracilibacillus sp.]|nr:hypothetical protein [Pseudogracilibacillus sp.]
MTGKKIVFIIILFSIIVLALGWLWLQNIMNKYELDEAASIHTTLTYLANKL